jgi:hypothetical protein
MTNAMQTIHDQGALGEVRDPGLFRGQRVEDAVDQVGGPGCTLVRDGGAEPFAQNLAATGRTSCWTCPTDLGKS